MATPRTITAVYASRTLITRPIPLDVRTDTEAVLDLASAALEDRVTSSDSVYQLGAAVLELESSLRLAREDAATSRAQLIIAQGLAETRERLLQEERTLRLAALADAQHLRAESIRLADENRQLRTVAALDALAISVVGVDSKTLAADLTDQLRREERRSLLERQRCVTRRIVQDAAVLAAYRSPDLMFDASELRNDYVSDTDVVDEPVAGRAQTMREVTP